MDLNIYEVGPRDGLQNSEFSLTTGEKTRMIDELYHAGLKNIEIASFVNPKKVPNMADAEGVVESTRHLDDFGVLIPNSRGLDRAKAVGAKKFNVFFSHSDEFNITNFDSSIAGLGGCPFIPNSGSNLSTNTLIHWADNNGYDTGIDIYDLSSVTHWLLNKKRLGNSLKSTIIT